MRKKTVRPTVVPTPTTPEHEVGSVVLEHFDRSDVEVLHTLVQNANFPGKMAGQVMKLSRGLTELHNVLPPLPAPAE